ncbi:MAG TPA: GNAT family N-acetyltransferase [Solirubrobacterales bacterium]
MSGQGARAELIDDRGEAAVVEDFFRSRPFLDAEGVSHTLRIETDAGEELLAPLIVRPVGNGPERDAISPYGYPGLVPLEPGKCCSRHAGTTAAAPEGGRLDPDAIDFGATGLISIFLRHRLGPPPLARAGERNVVQIADPDLPPKSRPGDRRQIRKNLEAGYEVELVPAAETTPEQRGAFLDLYEQTMRRTAAAAHYFFGAAYFDRILEADRTWLAFALAPGGDPVAASIAAAGDGYLHYYLSGSADSHLRDSPMKNVVSRLVEHSTHLGLPLNLGGGIARGDALEEFKRGFANREQVWHTSEIVCDRAAYDRLSAGRAAAGFFPAYRA